MILGGRRHGTTARYYRDGCRCPPCVKAARDYQRAWRARNPMYHTDYGRLYRLLGGPVAAIAGDTV